MTARLHADYNAARAELHAAREALHAARVRVDGATLGLRETVAALVAIGLTKRCSHCRRPTATYLCPACARATHVKRRPASRARDGEAPAPQPPRAAAHVWALPGVGGEVEYELVDPRRPALTTGGGHLIRDGHVDKRGRTYRGVRAASRTRERRAA